MADELSQPKKAPQLDNEPIKRGNIFKRWWFWLAIVIVLAGIAYGASRLMASDSGQFTSNSKGMSVSPSVNSNGASQSIGESGGSVSLDLASGSKATLSLADKALQAGDTISLKKIESISGIPAGTTFITGVEIGPDGTWLDHSGELSFPVPADKASASLIGFSYSSSGNDFHFYPVEISGGNAKFTLSGFSGYGLLDLGEYKEAPTPPTSIQKQAEQYIATIVSGAQSSTGGINDDQRARIKNILDAWFKVSVSPNLKEAGNNPDKIDSALHEFIAWRKFAQIFGVEDDLKASVESELNLLATAVKNGGSRASENCTKDKDPLQAVKLLRYKKITEIIDIDGREGLKESALDDSMKKCVKFKLTISSKITMTAAQVVDVVEASGEGTILYQDNMQLSGSAEVRTTSSQTEGMPPCTSNVPEVWKINIPTFSLASSSNGPKFNLAFDLSAPDAGLVWTCPFGSVEGETTDPNPAWGFDFLHKDEVTNFGEGDGSVIKFIMPNWDIVGKGGVFARKVYDRNLSADLPDGTFHEQTTFELVHTPQG